MTNLIKRHKADIIIVLSLFIFALILVLVTLGSRTEGDKVTVKIDGTVVATYSLAQEGEYRVGDNNVIVIEDGCVYMKDAVCPTGSCVRTGKIRYVGESIVCLPNRVVIAIEGEGGVDFVS